MAAPADEILVDARLLQPGQHIGLLLHRHLFPLYAILDSRGYRHDTAAQADGSYVILIRPAQGNTLQEPPAA